MAKYPGEIYEPREKEQRSGVEYVPEKKSVIFVEDVKKLDDEVVAVETDLIARRNAFLEVSFGRGEGGEENLLLPAGQWVYPVPFSSMEDYILYDPGNNWNSFENYYVVPVSGIYEIITKLRISDNPNQADFVHGTLQSTGVTALILHTAPFRQPMTPNIIKSHFNAGDHIQMSALCWLVNNYASDGYMSIQLLSRD